MILPNVRASFGRTEAELVAWLNASGDGEGYDHARLRVQEEGFDSLLDDPRTLNGLLTPGRTGAASPGLIFYVLVRHALLEDGIDDRVLADYMAALLLAFGHERRAYQVDADEGERFQYLTDIVDAMESASGRREFLLRAHLGEFALWISGLFPDYIVARVHRRGAPGIEYYEQVGANGYRLAAACSDARNLGLNRVYNSCADAFPALRVALNRIADRYFFPTKGDPVDRLLRQVADRFRGDAKYN